MITKYEVGRPFPGAVPDQEGAILELDDGGLILLIQYPGLSPAESAAFERSFTSYWILDSFPVIWLAFGFGAPFGAVEVNFDARIARPSRVEHLLDTSDEGIPQNMLTIYLLDGKILRGIKVVGLHHEAVDQLHVLIRRQLAEPYTRQEYLTRLDALERAYDHKELAAMATRYRMANDLIGVKDAARELGISPRRVLALIEAKRLPAFRVGVPWLIRRCDLDLVRDRPPGRPPKT